MANVQSLPLSQLLAVVFMAGAGYKQGDGYSSRHVSAWHAYQPPANLLERVEAAMRDAIDAKAVCCNLWSILGADGETDGVNKARELSQQATTSQVRKAALDQIYEALNVDNQTDAMAKIDRMIRPHPMPPPTPERIFLDAVLEELSRARAKFPGDNLNTIAMMEEAGEVAKAVLEESPERVRRECIQLAVMAARITLDGDSSTDTYRRRYHELGPVNS